MNFKRFIAKIMICGLSISVCSNYSNLTAYAEEIPEEIVTEDSDGLTYENMSEEEINTEEIDKLDINLLGTLESESTELVSDKIYTCSFLKNNSGKRYVYKLNLKKDAVVNFSGTSTGGGDGRVTFYIYNYEGNHFFAENFDINSNVGFRKYDFSFCLSKDTYYISLEESNWFDFVGECELKATVEYPDSTEVSPNGNCTNAQEFDISNTQYGMLGYNDSYDTFKFNVKYKGNVIIDLNATPIGKTNNTLRAYILNSYGETVKMYDIDLNNLGNYKRNIEILLEPGDYFFQLGSPSSYGEGVLSSQVTYNFKMTLPGDVSYVQMYRLYNPNSGEHFYTANYAEMNNLVNIGWSYEGVAWNAPTTSDIPVYRLYNPNAGDHHYTTSVAEKNNLVKVGWKYEGIGWYSTGTEGKALYRLYNPNATGAGSHHYTTNASERDNLVKLGWRYEGIAWYGGR